MTSSGVESELASGPVYFFDQPTRRVRGRRCNILQLSVANSGPSGGSSQSNHNAKQGESEQLIREDLPGETCEDGELDISSASLNSPDRDLLDAYRRAAPHLLNQLAHILSQHQWPEKRCIPLGVVNILNYSWKDLTAGVELGNGPRQRSSEWALNQDQTLCEGPPGAVEGQGERPSCDVGNVVSSSEEGKETTVRSNPRVKKRRQNVRGAHTSTTVSLSTSPSCSGSGWIVQTSEQPSYDEPHRISLCRWVVERLQATRSPPKVQSAEQDSNTSLILRHYGDAHVDQRETRGKVQTNTPQTPEVKPQSPALKKLHYRICDGSSFVYYPSGCVAVCQSHSGRPRGGFYTNVFSDATAPPVALASITAWGRGAATHPRSSAIAAVWDQDGGFMCDPCGNMTKKWSWKPNRTPTEKIIIKLSDLISVRLLSGVSATLTFRCDGETVQLPLMSLPRANRHKDISFLRTEEDFTSDAAQDLMLLQRTRHPAETSKSSRSLKQTTEVLQVGGEVEGPQGPRPQWIRGGPPDRELKKLQQRAQNILENWLNYYRVAIGVRCPGAGWLPGAPARTGRRGAAQRAALPSLNPPERAEARQPGPEGDHATESQQLHRHSSAAADAAGKLPRTPKSRAKREQHVTVIGPLKIYGNSSVESVTLPDSPSLHEPVAPHCPPEALSTPSAPFTVCPSLLRAAIQGEVLTRSGRRRCCCSATQMPSVTDLEYDAFVAGQLSHSAQMLVVCVSQPQQPYYHTQAEHSWGAVEELYTRRNRHRTRPCTQCQMDSFRLVRYEMSAGEFGRGVQNLLLQQRHDAAPGMILLYIRGQLLFVGFTPSCSATHLQEQICKSRRDYRLGLSLPPDYRFSHTVSVAEKQDDHDWSLLT